MVWKITPYNGTWIKSMDPDVRRAVDYFLEETGLSLEDIKLIERS
jgi:hypothetical protein